VTETFGAVTPRMLAAAASGSNVEGGELVQVGVSGSSSLAKPSSAAVTVVGKMKTRQKEAGFQVLVGAADKLHASLDAGAVGAILAIACLAPTSCYEIYAAWKEGDNELARLKQERIAVAAQRVVSELGIPGVKYAWISMDTSAVRRACSAAAYERREGRCGATAGGCEELKTGVIPSLAR